MPEPSQSPDNPGVHFPPPSLFSLSLLGGIVLEATIPYPLSKVLTVPLVQICGWTSIAMGLIFLQWALYTFRQQRTAIYPNRAASKLVEVGPYRISRNPMYVALSMIIIGIALLADNLYMLILLPVVLLLLFILVIRREEKYLQRSFGEEYLQYQKRVRRWL